MRHIRKGPEPPEFTAWKASGNDDWQPSYADLRGACKESVLAALLQEQGSVCCYCEQRIVARSCHIEHLVPQRESGLALEFANLLASCSAPRSEHCGHKKGERKTPVHPLQQDCGSRFTFGSAGTIAPRAVGPDPAAARTAIAILGLDSDVLVARRREAIGALLEVIAAAGTDHVPELMAALLERDAEQRWPPYGSAMAQVLARAGGG